MDTLPPIPAPVPQPLPLLKQPRVYIPIAILFFLSVGVNAFVYFKGPQLLSQMFTPTPTPTSIPASPTPTPSPIPLPPGKGVYHVSQGQHQGPTISRVNFDPLDVRSGQKLTIIVKVTDKNPVTSVTAVLQLDQTQKDLVFKLISGDALSGDWQTSIKIDDTLWYRYILTITGVSAGGTNKAIIAPRS